MTPKWSRIDLSSSEAVQAMSVAFEGSPILGQLTLRHDPRWVMALADRKDKTPQIYASYHRDQLVGLATFLSHPSSLKFSLGELTVFSSRVCRLDAFAAPIIDCGGDRAAEILVVADLFARMRSELRPNGVIFLESVREGTAMFELVSQRKPLDGSFHVLQHGSLYRHHFASISDSLDGYLKQVSARTRADLRSNRKRFVAHVEGDYRTRRFSSPSDVPDFVADAMQVSRKTYQYRLLGLGLRDREQLERRYLSAAALGWFRSYVLYANQRPIAFQVGYVYRGRFHAHDIGYDPDWASHHVGIFLHTEIIADLSTTKGNVTEFDFGIGDMLHKRRLGTHSRLEGNFYLLPSHLRGSVMALSMRVTDKVSGVLGSALERFGLRTKVRNLLRRVGAAQ